MTGPVDVAAIRAALEKATAGPWGSDPYGGVTVGQSDWRVIGELDCPPDAALIVLLRNNAEALLDMITTYETLLEYLGAQYGRLLYAHEQVVMDSPEDRELHNRVIAEFKQAVEALRKDLP
jgi:hypothetical protein